MTWATEDAFNEAVERRVADIRAHLLSQDTAEAMQLAIVNTHMEDKRPEMWASAAVYTSAALAVVSSALAASSADPLADENPEGGYFGEMQDARIAADDRVVELEKELARVCKQLDSANDMVERAWSLIAIGAVIGFIALVLLLWVVSDA